MMFMILAASAVAGLGVGICLGYLINQCYCTCHHHHPHHPHPHPHPNAVRAAFTENGVEVMDPIVAHVGDAPRTFELDLFKPDNTLDLTYENARAGYGALDGPPTADDGSSSIVLTGKSVQVTFLAPSALDESDPPTAIPSIVFADADSDSRPDGTQLVGSTLSVTVLALDINADHADFRETTGEAAGTAPAGGRVAERLRGRR